MDYLFGFSPPQTKSVVSFLSIDAIKNEWDRRKISPISNRIKTRYHKSIRVTK